MIRKILPWLLGIIEKLKDIFKAQITIWGNLMALRPVFFFFLKKSNRPDRSCYLKLFICGIIIVFDSFDIIFKIKKNRQPLELGDSYFFNIRLLANQK